MPIVYLDILIALNWIIDTLLLYATAHVLRLTPRRIRVIVSGFSGAVSSCLIFLSDLPTAALLVLHVLCACILVKIAYRFTGVKDFFKQTAVLYILSALFSGVITALWTLTDSEVLYTGNGIVYADISPLLLTGFRRCQLWRHSSVRICYSQARTAKSRVSFGSRRRAWRLPLSGAVRYRSAFA